MEKQVPPHFNFIDYLRTMGMFLVAWCHLVGNMNPEWQPLSIVQWIFNRPLSLIQNFGAFAVSIFFLISGFLMCESSGKISAATPIKYFIYKSAGILLPLWIEMFAFSLVSNLAAHIWGTQSYWKQFSTIDWIKSATLYNCMIGQSDAVNGPLWYLFPLFLTIILGTIFRFYSTKSSLKFIIFSTAVILFCFIMGKYVPSLCANLTYIPIILWGYLINLHRQKIVSKKQILFWGFVCYLLIVYGFYRFQNRLYQEMPHTLSSVLALLVFLIAYLVNSKKTPPKPVIFFSSISYSFYILHSLWGGG